MTRRTGLYLQNIGMTIIVTVMLLDHYVFALSENYILTCAIISFVLMAIGIRVIAKYDGKKKNIWK